MIKQKYSKHGVVHKNGGYPSCQQDGIIKGLEFYPIFPNMKIPAKKGYRMILSQNIVINNYVGVLVQYIKVEKTK